MDNIKKITIIVVGVIVLALALIFIAPRLINHGYTYTSPSGQKFDFMKEKIGTIQVDVLNTYIHYSGDSQAHQYVIPLRNGPNSLKDVYVEKDINEKILNKTQVYLTLDPNANGEAVISDIEVSKVIGTASYGIFKIPVENAITHSLEGNRTKGIPIITCDNATNNIGVVWFNLGPDNKIYSDKECVIVEGTDYNNMIKSADRLVYNLLGVM